MLPFWLSVSHENLKTDDYMEIKEAAVEYNLLVGIINCLFLGTHGLSYRFRGTCLSCIITRKDALQFRLDKIERLFGRGPLT